MKKLSAPTAKCENSKGITVWAKPQKLQTRGVQNRKYDIYKSRKVYSIVYLHCTTLDNIILHSTAIKLYFTIH